MVESVIGIGDGRRLTNFALFGLLVVAGCETGKKSAAPAVGNAWQKSTGTDGFGPMPNDTIIPTAADGSRRRRVATDLAQSVATVDGRPITRDRLVELLMRSRGASVLEQLVVLDGVESMASQKGVSVSSTEAEAELERTLHRLLEPEGRDENEMEFPRREAERILELTLADREVSREEFLLGMRRNALLRKLVSPEVSISKEEVNAEFDRTFGQKAQVRHIQLSNLKDAAAMRERLATGEEFAALAGSYSTHPTSAELGGLLDPFAASDESVPLLLRETAFRMKVGDTSNLLRIGDGFHIIRLEKMLPAESIDRLKLQPVVERRVLERKTETAMAELYRKLARQAAVKIYDPVLEECYEKRLRGSGP